MKRYGKKYSKLLNLPQYETNPFAPKVSPFKEGKIAFKKQISDQDLVDRNTGEIIKYTTTDTYMSSVDKEPFLKLYFKSIPSLFELRPVSIHVLIGYFGLQLQNLINKDVLVFDVGGCSDELNITRQSVWDAFYELVEKEYIAPIKGTNFSKVFINLDVLYNGIREPVVNEYRKREGLPLYKAKKKKTNKSILE